MRVGKEKLKIEEIMVKSFITVLPLNSFTRAHLGGLKPTCAETRCGTSTAETFLPPCPPVTGVT